MQPYLRNNSFSAPTFGSAINSRDFACGRYRYGFNGMEKDSENNSGAYDFGARIYDSRLGRWLALDQLMSKYPSFSDYSYVANNPIIFIDPDGKIIKNPYDPNIETDKENYIKVQRAIDIVKATMPELYNKLHDDAKINIEIRIEAFEGVNFDQKYDGFETNKTINFENKIESHNIGKTKSSYMGSAKVKIEKDDKGGYKIYKNTGWDHDKKEPIYTETTIEELEEGLITVGNNFPIKIHSGVNFQSTLGEVLAHELGHVEYNISNPTRAGIETLLVQDGLMNQEETASEQHAEKRDTEFKEENKKLPENKKREIDQKAKDSAK
jgi:RHS repeat-associated protein